MFQKQIDHRRLGGIIFGLESELAEALVFPHQVGDRPLQHCDNFLQRRPIVRLGRPEGAGEQDRVRSRRAEVQEIGEPGLERRRVDDVASFHRPFETMRISERADGKGRRQP